jgi:hypothetical protein
MSFTPDDFVKMEAQRQALVQQYITQRDANRTETAMTDDELKAIEARANAATPDLEYGSVIDDDSQQKEDVVFSIAHGRVATLHGGLSLQTVNNGMLFTRARPDILALVAEVRRLQDVVQVARGALADIADMTPREIADGVAQRKALRVYAETGLPKPMK